MRGPDFNVMFALLFFGSLLLIALVAILGGFLGAWRNRSLEHAERMRALELGRPWPIDQPQPKPATKSESASDESMARTLIVRVPLGALGIALGATVFLGPNSLVAWVAAGAVGVSGVICGTILTLRQGRPADEVPYPTAKPAMDPDTFDVVGRRG